MTDLALLDATQATITARTDPDGPDARGALLLAADTAAAAAATNPPDTDRWVFAAIAVREAIDRLTEDLSDDLVLAVDLPSLAAAATAAVHPPLRSLIGHLVDFYATAASGDTGSPWRRLVWAAVADHLDRAAGELP
ncbi:MAG: hypothetical protein JXA67_22255 [Micromonosporaceae bacterium]|nr:hypothetical protein [Micromonosporaceae bacterium]